MFSIFDKRIKYGFFHKIKSFKPLFYIDYNAKRAFEELNKACGYEPYGNKHCESILTKFLQVYYLPLKFRIDKRKSHYSSMIVSGQMTREEAIKKLSEPLYDENLKDREIDFVLNKTGNDQKRIRPDYERASTATFRIPYFISQ